MVSGTPDSKSCIPNFKAHAYGFHKQKLAAFIYMGRGIENELLNKLNELAQLSIKHRVEVIKSVVFCLVVNLSCFFSLLM